MSIDPKTVEQAAIHQLQQIIDPETGVDVVRMRLIEDLTVDEKGTVRYHHCCGAGVSALRRRCVPSP